MSTPIVSLIHANMLSTLAGITTGAGYNYTLIAEDSDPAQGNEVRDGLAVLTPPEKPQELTATVPHRVWQGTWTIQAHAIASETGTTEATARAALPLKAETIGADIIKALMGTHTRGGYAWDTICDFPAIGYNEGGNIAQVTINVTVKYETAYSDPFSQ